MTFQIIPLNTQVIFCHYSLMLCYYVSWLVMTMVLQTLKQVEFFRVGNPAIDIFSRVHSGCFELNFWVMSRWIEILALDRVMSRWIFRARHGSRIEFLGYDGTNWIFGLRWHELNFHGLRCHVMNCHFRVGWQNWCFHVMVGWLNFWVGWLSIQQLTFWQVLLNTTPPEWRLKITDFFHTQFQIKLTMFAGCPGLN